MLKDLASLHAPQHQRLIRLVTPLTGHQELLVDTFSGVEAVSELFSIDLQLLSHDAGIELKSLIGKPAQIQIELADGNIRYLDGCFSHFNSEGSDGGWAKYSATLKPWLWHLSRREDARIFQEKTVEDIIRAVLAEYGTLPSVEFRLLNPLKTHSYMTQYFETDLNFVMRLLEDDGLFFFFEHSAQGHRMVIGDDSRHLAALPEQPVIRYHSAAITETADAITQWGAYRSFQPGSLSVQTFDYRQPGNLLPVSMKSINNQGDAPSYSVYDYTVPYSHADYAQGGALARRRVEAIEVQSKGFKGTGHCRSMRPGYTFELTQHFDHDNAPRKERQFLLLRVEHIGRNNYLSTAPAHYANTFSCVRDYIPFRPERSHPRPIIPGPLSAIVTGPEGEEVFTDEMGRIQVRFHWQRRDDSAYRSRREDTQNTTWLRVVMPSAGEGFGHQFLPRVGQEVIVQHMGGDADRPVVTGVVYNAVKHTPSFTATPGLPGNKALSGIKTREHKGRGYNELLLDDTHGAPRARLATTHHTTALNLGRLTGPREQGTAKPLGNGAELRTDAAIGLRAAQGVLLTTHATQSVADDQLERGALLKLLTQCADIFSAIGQTANARGTQAIDPSGIDALRQALDQWPAPDSNAKGEPVIAMTAENGIASATPASHIQYAGANHDTTAQDHLHLTSGAGTHLHAGKGISAFAQDEGITAIANRGKVTVQAQEDSIALNAQHNLMASASEGEIVLTAPTIRLVAADGSYLKIGGGVELGSSSTIGFYANQYDWRTAKSDSATTPSFGRDPASQRVVLHYPGHTTDMPALLIDKAYSLKLEDGTVLSGLTDSSGATQKVENALMQKLEVSAHKDGPQ
ncbi:MULTISPECIES: type VI secretion system Vgr family protein [unclassified Pseudomonas]|uniref:type VI secretion system Vgr family protein n=1 Tax=unclassified Pseudomonas TaxID=196821 RepID=UPI000D35ADE1|nr:MULTISPECIES: type VI secretion system Vgr family protein [unclassified Pseudomonas]RAU39515.1 type VI secretion system tip protein VgrG [Pseudomonas sp. RIT 409]RAU55105.1 type VI secretion system tip protein VgrG [Pseudomonas sp. RIT 412]